MDVPLTAYQFRYCPASYIDDSYVPMALAKLIKSLPDWRKQNAINAWLVSELALSIDYELPEMLGGLAFYGQPALELTLGCIGALLHGQAIRQVIDSASLQPIHAAIGEAGHRYCLEQLDLIIGHWPPGWQQPLPEGEVIDYLRYCGLEFWLFAAGDVDDSFARRLALRLPRGPVEALWSFHIDQRQLAKALCLKVARHMSPTCFHLLK